MRVCVYAGFMLHAEVGAEKHELITPTHKWVDVETFTHDEGLRTNKVGSTRIHVERMFRRAQEWKALHRLIKISQMDIAGTIFKICCYMSNFEPNMIRQKGEPLVSVAELQWGFD